MIVAISSTGPDLNSTVDPRFGRCAYIIFYDTDTEAWEAVSNANMDSGGGAGIRTAQAVVDRGTEVVITGNVGPNAMRVLATQVKIYTGFGGSIEEAIRTLGEGGLDSTSSPTVGAHSGQSGAPGGPVNPGGAPGGPMNPPGAFGGPINPGGAPGGPINPGGAPGGPINQGGAFGGQGGGPGSFRGGRGRGGGGGRGGGRGMGNW